MAEEEVAVSAAASYAPSDHKRKLENLEPDAPAAELKSNSELEPRSVEKTGDEDVTGDGGADADSSEPKRPRLEDKPDVLATENGCQEEKVDEPKEEEDGLKEEDEPKEQEVEGAEQPAAVKNNTQSEEAQEQTMEAQETENNAQAADDDHKTKDTEEPCDDKPQLEKDQEQQEPSKVEVSLQEDVPSAEQKTTSKTQTMSRKMEVPNNKVGVLIGKSGDTIRSLQQNSGARIQITRDSEADPRSTTRHVELIGSLENINKAEKLIKDVIAEADAGGSPSLVARGYNNVQASEGGEQIQIQVPYEKVGLIIGKGGETIKHLQTKSGARIQLIPPSEGDQSKGKMVRVTGDKRQIEMARQMIMDVMNQTVRSSSSGYNQQAFRPRGPVGPQWGPRGPHPAQPTGYDYQQRGPYPSQNHQYPSSTYGNYPSQQLASRSSFGPGWEQRPPATMQGPPSHGGYDYYGVQGGHGAAAPASAAGSSPMGPPVSQENYNYGHPHTPNYGQPTPYYHAAPPAQSYGHGYSEAKYENQVAVQHPYGGSSQPSAYPQSTVQPGYNPQDQYGKAPPSYGMPPQGPHSQSYSQPRPNHSGDMPYQGSNMTPQQPYPYVSSGPMQQTYPPYGSASGADGYNQPPPATASVAGYSQQSGQPVSGYGQPAGQQAPGYSQAGPPGGYPAYPSSQTGYPEQPAPNNASYGYQGQTDPAYGSAYGAPSSAQPGYAQPAPTQPGYDQSMPQSGGYASVTGSAPVGLSPQPVYPQYDSSQMYGAHH